MKRDFQNKKHHPEDCPSHISSYGTPLTAKGKCLLCGNVDLEKVEGFRAKYCPKCFKYEDGWFHALTGKHCKDCDPNIVKISNPKKERIITILNQMEDVDSLKPWNKQVIIDFLNHYKDNGIEQIFIFPKPDGHESGAPGTNQEAETGERCGLCNLVMSDEDLNECRAADLDYGGEYGTYFHNRCWGGLIDYARYRGWLSSKKAIKFIKHIEQHLKEMNIEGEVCCKICDKTISEISEDVQQQPPEDVQSTNKVQVDRDGD